MIRPYQNQIWCLKQCYKNADKIITKTGHEDNERFESPLTDIEITLENEEPYQVASIRNYARGIRYERLPKIFGRYTQGGTGLGLEVVKRLCELSNGFVVVKSAREDNKAHAHDTTNPVSYIEQLEGDFKRGTEFQMHFKI